jgi:hypothetical protein
MIPEQRTPVFAGQSYEIGVEQTSPKTYTYILYNNDSIIERWTGDKHPNSINKTANFVNDCCKKIGEVKVNVDGTVFTYSKDQVKDKVMSSFIAISAMFDAYAENKAENELKEQQEKEEELEQLLGDRFDEFADFLIEHNLTLNQFLFYAAEWLAGGETHNILKGTFCHLSTYFLIKPIWFLPLGKAGEGKSVIDEASVAMLPDDVFENGRVTESALHRKSNIYGKDYVDGKVMRMKDMGGDRDFEKWSDTIDRYKELTTEGEVEIEMTGEGIDQDTGERKVINFKLEGYCSCCITSVNSECFDGQILSRGIDVAPTATNEQVKMYAKYNHGTVERYRQWIIDNHLALFHDYVRYLKLYVIDEFEVINPYWECLEEWFKETEFYKRNLSLYPALVETVTLLNADYRKKITAKNGQQYLVSTMEDNKLIGDLFNPSQGLTNNAIRIFNLLVRKYGNYKPNTLEETFTEEDAISDWEEYSAGAKSLKNCDTLFTVANVRRAASKDNNKYKGLPYGDIIQSLVNVGFVQVMGKVKRGNHNVYALDHWEPVEDMTIVFDEECISKYVDEMSGVFGVTRHALWEIVEGEKIENDELDSNAKVRLPPWVSPIGQGVVGGVKPLSIGVGNTADTVGEGVGK